MQRNKMGNPVKSLRYPTEHKANLLDKGFSYQARSWLKNRVLLSQIRNSVFPARMSGG